MMKANHVWLCSPKGVPQVLFFNEGEFLGKYAGKKDEEVYTAKIDEILNA